MKAPLHGAGKRRQWSELHLCIDRRTKGAVACSMIRRYVLDRGEPPQMLDGVEGEVAEVLGDGA